MLIQQKKIEYYDAQTTEIERVLKPLIKTLAAQSLDISLIESLQRSLEQGITDSQKNQRKYASKAKIRAVKLSSKSMHLKRQRFL